MKHTFCQPSPVPLTLQLTAIPAHWECSIQSLNFNCGISYTISALQGLPPGPKPRGPLHMCCPSPSQAPETQHAKPHSTFLTPVPPPLSPAWHTTDLILKLESHASPAASPHHPKTQQALSILSHTLPVAVLLPSSSTTVLLRNLELFTWLQPTAS